MLNRILTLFGALLLLGTGAAFAQNSATFNVSVTIRTPITVSKVADLDFGTVEALAATYTVNPSTGPHSAGTAAIAASFTISGEASQVADVTLSPNPVTAVNGINNVSINLTPQAATHTFTGASETFYVGGNVTLVGTEASGLYTATATLQLLYQ